MTRGFRIARMVLLVAALGSAGCVSDSILGGHTKEQMLRSAPPGYECQVITFRVRDKQYGRLTVDQTVVELLRKRPGVLQVKRGTGREEIYVLTETRVDPYEMAVNTPDRYQVRVVDVTKTEVQDVPTGTKIPNVK